MTKPPIIKSLTRRYVAVLCVLAGFMIIGSFTFRLIIVGQETVAADINVSGRQRMLLQRIALSTYIYANSDSATEKKQYHKMLVDSIFLMERSHRGLSGGNKEMNLSTVLSPEIRAMYLDPSHKLNRKMLSFLADAKSIAAADGTIGLDDPRLLRLLAAAQGPFANSLDAIVRRHQRESEARVKLLNLVSEIGLAVSLFVLAVSAFGVFRPLVRRTAEEMEKLVKSEIHTRTIIECAMDCIVAMDEEGLIVEFNPSAEQAFGYTRDEVLGQPMAELLIPPRLRDRHRGRVENCLTTGEGKNLSKKINVEAMRADGSEFPVELAISVSSIGEQQIFTGYMRDITERKRYEEKLEISQMELERKVAERTQELSHEITKHRRTEIALGESQQRLQAITGSLFEGVLVVDINGHIVFSNRSAATLLSRPGKDNLAGLDIDEVFLLKQGGEDIHFTDGPFVKVAENSQTIRDEDAVFVTRYGDDIHVAFAASPLLENGKSNGTIISFRDIHELKEAQNEVLQASKLASVGQLAAGIAHEINTPIQYIGDNLRFLSEAHEDIVTVLDKYRNLARTARGADLLEDCVAKAEAAAEVADLEYILAEVPLATEQSLDGVKQVAGIVIAMKEFSHPGVKKKIATDLNRAINNTLMVCRNEWKHVADVDVELAPELPQIVCLPGELNQVFLNLIVNAAHAIEEAETNGRGRITVTTSHDGNWAEIRVADTGGGIPNDVREHIFDPFFTTKEVGKGTGQGLSICRDVVVKKHGGKMFFESQPGKGTTFVVQLPIDGNVATSEAG